MAIMRTLSLKDLESILARGDPYPYYAILLYPPLNGLNAKLHEYVDSHWGYLNGLTGDNCLLMALEARGLPIQRFRPEDVYAIARRLGAAVDQVPCLVFITDPHTQTQTLVQPLNPLFPVADETTDADLTQFFQGVQVIIDKCVASDGDSDHFACLQSGFDREYVLPARGRRALVMATTVAGPVMQILQSISTVLSSLPH